MKKILFPAVCFLLLSGCSDNKEEKVTEAKLGLSHSASEQTEHIFISNSFASYDIVSMEERTSETLLHIADMFSADSNERFSSNIIPYVIQDSLGYMYLTSLYEKFPNQPIGIEIESIIITPNDRSFEADGNIILKVSNENGLKLLTKGRAILFFTRTSEQEVFMLEDMSFEPFTAS